MDLPMMLHQKDLDLCQNQKAEAELTILNLARIIAQNAQQPAQKHHGLDMRPLQSLEQDLVRAKDENKELKAKLHSALDTIALLVRS